jgi:signal peptidase I
MLEPSPQSLPKSPSLHKSNKSAIAENIKVLAIALVIALLVRTFVAEPRFIPSGSMEPTMLINDRFIAEKISYQFRNPMAGEIVIFSAPEMLQKMAGYSSDQVLIKRLIGIPGDLIAIHKGAVSVNGVMLTEPYIKEAPDYDCPGMSSKDSDFCQGFAPNNPDSFEVPPGMYFAMGDNRNNSSDSHVWGFLPKSNIIGRAVLRFFPIDRIGGLS